MCTEFSVPLKDRAPSLGGVRGERFTYESQTRELAKTIGNVHFNDEIEIHSQVFAGSPVFPRVGGERFTLAPPSGRASLPKSN